MFSLPKARSVLLNPSQEELRNIVSKMPSSQKTVFGNFNTNTKVDSRSANSTFIVSTKTKSMFNISRKDYLLISRMQDAYIQDQDMLIINGYIGQDPIFRVGCQLFIEQSQANIAAMQQQLYFPPDKDFIPKFTVISTPILTTPGFPNDLLIAVDIENFTTRIIGTDYFGESKKGGLRMWNKWVYDLGGLALHAGCKVWPDIEGLQKLALIIGLSGTGKTTTTFREQLGSLPVQDDFCALLPQGVIYSSENGCFAKTYGLNPNEEPIIFQALTQPDSWLENVAVSKEGGVDFSDGNRTTNGRGIFQLEKIPHFNPINLPRVDYIFILNRNFDILPAVTKLKPEQTAAYFMLGETNGTSAGGKSEEGKFLRVPGTNPFFTDDDSLQGNRFLELLKTIPRVGVYLLNTGRIGGMENDPRSKKVSIQHSSAIQEGIVRNNIIWREDPDFGYFIADQIPGFDDPELLNPKLLYQRQNRNSEYINILNQLKNDRKEYLNNYPALDQAIKI